MYNKKLDLLVNTHRDEGQDLRTTKDTTTAGEYFPTVSTPLVERVIKVLRETVRSSIERSISRHTLEGATTPQPQHVLDTVLSTDASQDETRQSQSRSELAVDNLGDEMQDSLDHGSVKGIPRRGRS